METQNKNEITNQLEEERVVEGEKLHILIIGNSEWIKKHDAFLKDLSADFELEYISNIDEAQQRLWHNSYDLLVIEHKFCKQNTIDLTKYSYARSKPSIIVCENIFVKLYYTLWKKFSNLVKICKTMKKLMFIIKENDNELINQINEIAYNKYSFTTQINIQIQNYYESN